MFVCDNCSLRTGGHIYYVAAHDILALCALIDASECKPTFGARKYLKIIKIMPRTQISTAIRSSPASKQKNVSFHFAPGLCVHLFVCLSVCSSVYLRKRVSEFRQIFCTCYLWPWLGRPLTAMQRVKYFRFCG